MVPKLVSGWSERTYESAAMAKVLVVAVADVEDGAGELDAAEELVDGVELADDEVAAGLEVSAVVLAAGLEVAAEVVAAGLELAADELATVVLGTDELVVGEDVASVLVNWYVAGADTPCAAAVTL